MNYYNSIKSTISHLILFSIIVLIAFSCNNFKKKKYKIGFSQCSSNGLWRQAMLQEMRRTAMYYDDFQLEISDAGGNSQTQIEQIKAFIKNKVDLLIISPNEADPITPIAIQAFRMGIPTILIDRKINTRDYTSYVGGNNYAVGYSAGQYLAQISNGIGNVLEVTGLSSSSNTIERDKGFTDAIEPYKNLHLVDKIEGKWLEDTAYERLKDFVLPKKISYVFAHSDAMAFGAYKALKAKSDSIIFIGINAQPGSTGGIQMVIDGILKASFTFPTGGKEAVELAFKILKKESINKNNILPSTRVDKVNATIIQQQNETIIEYMSDIDNQQDKLRSIVSKYNGLKLLTLICIAISCLLIIFVVLTIRAYRIKNKMFNKVTLYSEQLTERQKMIEEQSEKLKIQKDELSNTNATKDKLFSILAHDLRNPFNVIINFSEMLMNDRVNLTREETDKYLQIINSSTNKANDLIENILQWSRSQTGKISFNPEQLKLSAIVSETIELLKGELFRKSITIKNLIDFKVIVNADLNMLKVIFRNLISNAIKFTAQTGTISIYSNKVSNTPAIKISVADTGIGIPSDILETIFQPNHNFTTMGTENETGTGLGLILCKEFIEKHHGKIWVESKLNEGSTFHFTMPLTAEDLINV
jgi:signal transduction histidine kinase/DNA-binding LacI/PurR family transcriptional regulator